MCINSRRFGSLVMATRFGEKAATISDCRVILYREPVILVVACLISRRLIGCIGTYLVGLSSFVETS